MRISKRSSQLHRRANPVLLQDPDFPAPIPLPVEPKQSVDFTDPSVLRHVPTSRDGLTVMMPAVRPAPPQPLSPIQAAQSAENLTATQILPPVSEMLPPSVRHVDPTRRTTTFVEDNDLEPQSRGRHVLAELSAGPDVATELMAIQSHVHDIFDPMRRAEVAARASDERMRAFVAQWDARQDRAEREFENWAARFKKMLADTRANWAETSGRTNAQRLAKAYEDGGTSAALYTTKQLAEEIARHETAGSAVAA